MGRGLHRLAALLLLAALLSISASAGDHTITAGELGSSVGVHLPDSYAVITADTLEHQGELLRRSGKTPEEIRPYFEQGCLFIALPPGRDFEISMTRMTDAVSQGMVNLIDLSLDEQDRVRDLLLGEAIEQGREVRAVERGGALFFRVSDREEDVSQAAGAVGEREKNVYYVTVLNGSYLTLSLSDPSGKLQSGVIEQFETVFQSLDFQVTGTILASESDKLQVVRILLWVCCALGVAAVVWLVLSISKEYHRRKRETAWQRKRRPKPRR